MLSFLMFVIIKNKEKILQNENNVFGKVARSRMKRSEVSNVYSDPGVEEHWRTRNSPGFTENLQPPQLSSTPPEREKFPFVPTRWGYLLFILRKVIRGTWLTPPPPFPPHAFSPLVISFLFRGFLYPIYNITNVEIITRNFSLNYDLINYWVR